MEYGWSFNFNISIRYCLQGDLFLVLFLAGFIGLLVYWVVGFYLFLAWFIFYLFLVWLLGLGLFGYYLLV